MNGIRTPVLHQRGHCYLGLPTIKDECHFWVVFCKNKLRGQAFSWILVKIMIDVLQKITQGEKLFYCSLYCSDGKPLMFRQMNEEILATQNDWYVLVKRFLHKTHETQLPMLQVEKRIRQLGVLKSKLYNPHATSKKSLNKHACLQNSFRTKHNVCRIST